MYLVNMTLLGKWKGKEICAALAWQNARVAKESEGEQGPKAHVCEIAFYSMCIQL